MSSKGCLVVRSAASLATALFLFTGCGTDGGSSSSSGTSDSGSGAASTSGSASSSATATSTGTGGTGGASSGSSTTTSSMATGPGGSSSTSTSTGGSSSTSTSAGGTGGGCTQVEWYCDADQDGHGDPNVSETACTPPPGGDAKCAGPYVASEDDCGPGDAAAYPGQQIYFSTPVMPPPPSPAFDYNCSGQEEKDPSQLYKGGMSLTCLPTECLMMPTPPRGFGPNAQCGQTTEYYQCAFSFGMCMLTMAMPPEPLRCR